MAAFADLPDGIDRATLLPRFKAFMEEYFFQGVYLDAAGRARLAEVTRMERDYFRALLDSACAQWRRAQASGSTAAFGAMLAEALPWLDEAARSRLSGATAYVMR